MAGVMRCAHCGRRLLEPAYMAPASAGAWVLGPVCMLKRDLPDEITRVLLEDRTARVMMQGVTSAPAKRKRGANIIPKTRQAKALPGQLDLFVHTEK